MVFTKAQQQLEGVVLPGPESQGLWPAARRLEPVTLGEVLLVCRAHGRDAYASTRPLGDLVLVGRLPGEERLGWAFKTRTSLVPTPRALLEQGLETDMVCWPTRREGVWTAVMGAPVRVGRAPSNEVALPHPDVSKLHARVWQRGEQLELEDAQSHNGTHINGKALAPGGRGTARDGDSVAFGPVVLRVMAVPRLLGLLLGV